MREFLQSHMAALLLFLMSGGPFFLSGWSSLVQWRPLGIALGELLLALLVSIALVVNNLAATGLLGLVFISSLGMIGLGWWKHKRIR